MDFGGLIATPGRRNNDYRLIAALVRDHEPEKAGTEHIAAGGLQDGGARFTLPSGFATARVNPSGDYSCTNASFSPSTSPRSRRRQRGWPRRLSSPRPGAAI